MNNKDKKDKNRDRLIPLIILIFLCLIGSGIFVFLFVRDLNMTFTKMNETPIANISFKYHSAHRKFLEKEIWDTLKQKSPLYNGDTIRTAPLSEATIYFNEDDTIELFEDSIIQIFMDDGELVVNVGSGNIVVKAGKNSKGIKVRLGKTYAKVQNGTVFNAIKDKLTNEMTFQAIEGGAYIFSEESEENDSNTFIATNEKLFYDENGNLIDMSNIPLVIVSNPIPNMKVIRTDKSEKTVKFKWISKNMEYDHPVLKIADNKDFEFPKFYDLSGIDGEKGFDVDIESGKYYWEVYPATAGDKYKSKSQFNIIQTEKPELIIPANEYIFKYKNVLPSVRFAWTDNDWFTNYKIEISSSQNFDKDLTEIVTENSYASLSTLENGKWYWRVIPTLGNKRELLENKSEIRTFFINQDSKMPKVKLLQPSNDYVFNPTTQTRIDDSQISFSWKMSPEASTYNLKISQDPSFSVCDVDLKTQNSFIRINKETITKLLEKSNKWYWSVLQSDEDGNVSELSNVRTFSIVDSDYENKLIFPPNDYCVENTRTEEVAFVWKSNFAPTENPIFQVAKDSEFNDVVINNKIEKNDFEKKTSIKNLNCSEDGTTYYWRIITKNDKQEEIVSKANKIRVLPPLNAPDVTTPSNRFKVGVAKEQFTTFEWNKIENADSYRFKIFKADDEGDAIFENPLVTENKLTLDLNQFSDGDYIWTVQANAMENETSTRFTGKIGRNEFGIRKIDFVDLEYPSNNEVLDGLNSFINPIKAEWNCDEKRISSLFKLYKKVKNPRTNEEYFKLIQTIQNPDKKIQLPRLEAGTYKWHIDAITQDGFDVSSTKENNFIIGVIPPLNKPILENPNDNSTLEAFYFKENKSITFSWDKISDASEYIITIKDSDGKILRKNNTKDKTSFEFTNINELSRGIFSWTVEAIQKLKDGTIVRKSSSKTSNFEISLPEIESIKLDETGELYGL